MALTEEQIGFFKKAFSLFDTDGDGRITTGEFTGMIRHMLRELNRPFTAETADMIAQVEAMGAMGEPPTIDFKRMLSLIAMAPAVSPAPGTPAGSTPTPPPAPVTGTPKPMETTEPMEAMQADDVDLAVD